MFPWACEERVALEAPQGAPAYDTGLRRLDTADAILAVVRREAARPVQATESVSFDVTIGSRTPLPPGAAEDVRGRAFRMFVDEQMAVVVRGWIDSLDPLDRENAVWALSHFESADNVACLKALLDDPYVSPDTFVFAHGYMTRNGEGKWAGVPYEVRHAAYRALRAWRVVVPTGIVLNRSKYPAAFLPLWVPTAFAWGAVALVLGCAAGVVMARRRWRRFATLSLILLLASGTLWLVGAWRITEFAFTCGGERYELAVWAGRVRLMRIMGFDDPLPPAVTTVSRSAEVDADWYPGPFTTRVVRWGATFDRGNVGCAGLPGLDFAAWTFPLWIPCGLCAIPVAALGVGGLRRRRQGAVGRCPRCGYDLRATPAGCPECGWGR